MSDEVLLRAESIDPENEPQFLLTLCIDPKGEIRSVFEELGPEAPIVLS
jgi:hypothetical protein